MNVTDWLLIPTRRCAGRSCATSPMRRPMRSLPNRRVAREGWGAQLLALQGADGYWRDRDEQADMVTVRALDELRTLGPDPANVDVQNAVERLRGARSG